MNRAGIVYIAMLLVACASTRTKMASEKKPASPPVDPGDLEMEEGLFHASMVDGYEFAAGVALLAPAHLLRSCQMVVLPSFTSERAVFIQSDEDGNPKIITTRAKRSLWPTWLDNLPQEHDPSQSNHQILADAIARMGREIETNQAPIDTNTSELLKTLWNRMLARVHFVALPRFGNDGTTFHFLDGHAAKTWSPEAGTLAADLVGVGEAMIAFAEEGEDKQEEARLAIVKKATALLARLDAIERHRRGWPQRACRDRPRSMERTTESGLISAPSHTAFPLSPQRSGFP